MPWGPAAGPAATSAALGHAAPLPRALRRRCAASAPRLPRLQVGSGVEARGKLKGAKVVECRRVTDAIRAALGTAGGSA